MFAVAPEEHRWGRAVLLLGASGTIGIVTGSVFASQAWIRAGAVAASVGAWLWAADMAGMLRRRTRRRIDAGLAYVITAIAFLLIASAIGLSLAWTGQLGPIPPDRAAIAYALLGLVGWIGFSIIGQFHKILPFLAWYHRYSSLVGTRRVPLIKDLFDFRIAWVGYGAAQIGIVALVVGEFAGSGLAVRLGGGGLAVGGLATAMMVAQCLTR
jgi:hypothetical protein